MTLYYIIEIILPEKGKHISGFKIPHGGTGHITIYYYQVVMWKLFLAHYSRTIGQLKHISRTRWYQASHHVSYYKNKISGQTVFARLIRAQYLNSSLNYLICIDIKNIDSTDRFIWHFPRIWLFSLFLSVDWYEIYLFKTGHFRPYFVPDVDILEQLNTCRKQS